ncbi:MAG: hypothetical protein OEM82_01030 [Acidobacteriota bacterium]|nr:hypothetical protein [Acidobacteriota bacterium]MDH3528827.1 hypothetical protein [Acidobacteriota bacterium]
MDEAGAEKIRQAAIASALVMLKNDEVNEAVSSTFYGNARAKLTEVRLNKIVKSRPWSTSGTSLAKTISAVGAGYLYRGRVTLYKPFFHDFNIAVGLDHTGQSLGLSMSTRRTIVLLHELSHLTRKYIDVFQLLGINYFDEAIYDTCTINKRIYEAMGDV